MGSFKPHEPYDNKAWNSRTFKVMCPIKVTTIKEFLDEIEKNFTKSDKAETRTLLANLVSIRYKVKGNIWE